MAEPVWDWSMVEPPVGLPQAKEPYRAKGSSKRKPRKPKPKPELAALTIRLPMDLYDRLKTEAINNHRSMTAHLEHLLRYKVYGGQR